jgi:phospholipase C
MPMRSLTATVCVCAVFAGVSADARAATIAEARQFVKHVVIIMQENRSFDSYFGTFPGADGLPTNGKGSFTVCIPYSVKDPAKGCVIPFHDTSLYQSGATHTYPEFLFDRQGGAMNGFVEQQELTEPAVCHTNPGAHPDECSGYPIHDVMGYHTAAEIPNYWHYAETYMLQDHLYEPAGLASRAVHLVMTSEWSAHCSDFHNPMSCSSSTLPSGWRPGRAPYAWTSLTWLLDNMGVGWKYYLSEGATPDCDDQGDTDTCDPEIQNSTTAGAWNPLPGFTTFAADVARNPKYASHVIKIEQFYADIAANKLPAVSWIVPNLDVSEHPGQNIVDGMNYVTSLVNTIMESPYYEDTVILISWDDWGGFYDHEMPPIVDRTETDQLWGYGFRVPGLVISPYVVRHFDHQTLSFEPVRAGGDHDREGLPEKYDRPDRRPAERFRLLAGTDPGAHSQQSCVGPIAAVIGSAGRSPVSKETPARSAYQRLGDRSDT